MLWPGWVLLPPSAGLSMPILLPELLTLGILASGRECGALFGGSLWEETAMLWPGWVLLPPSAGLSMPILLPELLTLGILASGRDGGDWAETGGRRECGALFGGSLWEETAMLWPGWVLLPPSAGLSMPILLPELLTLGILASGRECGALFGSSLWEETAMLWPGWVLLPPSAGLSMPILLPELLTLGILASGRDGGDWAETGGRRECGALFGGSLWEETAMLWPGWVLLPPSAGLSMPILLPELLALGILASGRECGALFGRSLWEETAMLWPGWVLLPPSAGLSMPILLPELLTLGILASGGVRG